MNSRIFWANAGALAGSIALAWVAMGVQAGQSPGQGASEKAVAGPATICPSKGAVQAVIASVQNGDTMALVDGRQLRLVSIQAPRMALGRAGPKDWPLADKAKAALEGLVGTGPIYLAVANRPLDRNGRHLAHAFTADGRWIQGELVRQGFARVYTWEDDRGCGATLLRLEQAARAAKAGIWSDQFYRVRSAESLGGDVESFQIVEGVVISTANVRGRTYLNFGADYRTDFTVTVMPDDAENFREAGFDLIALKGQKIRVRGWLKSANGAQILATHPEQIERLAVAIVAKP